METKYKVGDTLAYQGNVKSSYRYKIIKIKKDYLDVVQIFKGNLEKILTNISIKFAEEEMSLVKNISKIKFEIIEKNINRGE